MGLMHRYSNLDRIDVSLYLIYGNIKKIMSEIEKDYGKVFQYITLQEFKDYINRRYNL